jgi:Ca2+:H+ antiporter
LILAPVLVVLSFLIGPSPMAMVFNGYEAAGLIIAALVATLLVADGESTWFEGVQLLGVYIVVGMFFFYA